MKKILDNKFFKIGYGVIKYSFLTIIILYLSFILIQRITGNKSIFGYRVFTVATGSMAGVYDINDVILVADYDTDKLKVGDDVAYQGDGSLEGKLITHRIIRIEDEGSGRIFTTKGVKSDVEDPSITPNQILGKVTGIVPVVTWLNHAVKSQVGFFLLVFCPLVLVIALEVTETVIELKVEKNEIRKIEKKKKDDDIEIL
ncbi:MAG: signal peptidase I [Bacilli bacterium]|nr:signal peptidase I [Bacilli bacterium]